MSNAEFLTAVNTTPVDRQDYATMYIAGKATAVEDALAKLKSYWKVIKPLLKIIKLVTPPKIDKGIDEFIAILDKLTGGAAGDEKSKLLERFAILWGIIRQVLINIKSITAPKVDAVIDEVVKIGDLLSKS